MKAQRHDKPKLNWASLNTPKQNFCEATSAFVAVNDRIESDLLAFQDWSQ